MVAVGVAGDVLAMHNFAWTLLTAGGAILALGPGLGFWFTTRAIRPIETISAAASRISHGNLSERVEGAGSGDELGSLAEVLNSTFARLESAFARQRQFTADAAHELRTPLAVIISETQTTLARERTAAEYRETVEACLDTAQQMRRLTESLLELARFAADEDHPRGDVDVAETARLCVERIRFLAKQRGIEIETDFAPAHAFTNADRLSQAIANLPTNAIYYNKKMARSASSPAPNRTTRRSRSPTQASASQPPIYRIFSTGSIAWTKRVREPRSHRSRARDFEGDRGSRGKVDRGRKRSRRRRDLHGATSTAVISRNR